jgi:iron complex transport system permease protein
MAAETAKGKGPAFRWWLVGPFICLPFLLFFVSLMLGRFELSPGMVLKILAARVLGVEGAWPAVMETVMFQIRLPRVGAAMLIGGGLSISGASFQGLFRNPLISPFILGVASGAGFGAALGILLLDSAWMIQGSAFLFGSLAVGLSWALGRMYRAAPTLVLVLAGVIVGTFFSSLLSLIKYVADPYDKLPVIVYWLMGSLATVSVSDFWHAAGPILLGTLVLLMVRWRINVLSLGDEEARALGVETGRMKVIVILAATVITASAVSISGIIGWVGLVIPHLARMLTGPDYKKLLPASFVLGACYLLFIDDLARTVSSGEIPLGILTATVGAPVFALVLRKSSLGWSS